MKFPASGILPAIVALAFVLVSCGDSEPTSVSTGEASAMQDSPQMVQTDGQMSQVSGSRNSGGLTVPFEQTATVVDEGPLGLPAGTEGTFRGVLRITHVSGATADGLVTDGVIRGTFTAADGTRTQVNETFENQTIGLIGESLDGESCDILFLDVGPIFLDLLGLQVDLSQITLDINAVRGGLLGDLLCAIAGLLS